jgi:hypothetical protein
MTDEGCTGEGRGRGHTYTEAEVKVLTETATKVALELGRREALEEVDALLIEAGARGRFARQLIQHTVSLPSGATSDATSGFVGHPEVSEAARSPQEPCGNLECWWCRPARVDTP